MRTEGLQSREQAPPTPRLTLEQFRSGDSEAIGRVYPHLVRFARGFMGGKEGAEDLVQSALVQTIKPLKSRSPEDFARFGGNVLPYIYRAIVHTRINQVRRTGRRVSEVERSVDELPDRLLRDPGAPVDELVSASLDEGEVIQILGKEVKPDYLDALYLREGVGLTYQETADVLGIPLGTVQSRLHRAKTKTREKFGIDNDGALHRKP